ncbi:hypothetical protein NDU88_002510 [Pleurodeles waltl]|uniref:Uncharacterized protein n=1 Tax=Pleurodeles waltl TaxID=8319 RepID=A0AAV7SB50_PLEWA|nr:hypothetical protein NDU88_002510 [Pleurodeles waltl]
MYYGCRQINMVYPCSECVERTLRETESRNHGVAEPTSSPERSGRSGPRTPALGAIQVYWGNWGDSASQAPLVCSWFLARALTGAAVGATDVQPSGKKNLSVRGLRLRPVWVSREAGRIARAGAVQLRPRRGEATLMPARGARQENARDAPWCERLRPGRRRGHAGGSPFGSPWLREPPGGTEGTQLCSPLRSSAQRIWPVKKEIRGEPK